MAKQTHIVSSDEAVRVTVEPAGPADGAWFRLFRAVVHSGTWAKLPPAASKVLIVLAECVNDSIRKESGKWIAWPSVALICKRSGCERRAVQMALNTLETHGLLRRIRRRTSKRGDYSNEYELVCPPDNEADESGAQEDAPAGAHRGARGGAHSDAPPGAHLGAQGPAHGGARGHGAPVRRSGARGRAQQRKNETETDNNSSAVRAKLAAAGVGEPVLTRLLAERPPEELLLRLEDWKTRKAAGSQLGVAWLIASILQRYELHERTTAAIEAEGKRGRAEARRLRDLKDAAADAAALDEIEAQTAAMVDEMSDEELDHWKQEVIAELPALTRKQAGADPRTDPRLRRLIQGKLAHLIGPGQV